MNFFFSASPHQRFTWQRWLFSGARSSLISHDLHPHRIAWRENMIVVVQSAMNSQLLSENADSTCERMEIKGESGWVIKVDEEKVKKSAQLAQECSFGTWFMSRWDRTFSLKLATSISICKLLLRHFVGQKKGDTKANCAFYVNFPGRTLKCFLTHFRGKEGRVVS